MQLNGTNFIEEKSPKNTDEQALGSGTLRALAT